MFVRQLNRYQRRETKRESEEESVITKKWGVLRKEEYNKRYGLILFCSSPPYCVVYSRSFLIGNKIYHTYYNFVTA